MFSSDTYVIKSPEFAIEELEEGALTKVAGFKPIETLTLKNRKSTIFLFNAPQGYLVSSSNLFGGRKDIRVLGEGSFIHATGSASQYYSEVNSLPVANANDWVLVHMCNPNVETLQHIKRRNLSDMLDYLADQQMGDARLFADTYRERVIYDTPSGKWYIWTGNYWEEDWNGQVWNMLATRIASEYKHAEADVIASNMDTEKKKELEKAFKERAASLKSKSRAESVLEWAAKQDGMALKGDEWDKDNMLLGVGNGVIDLRTGEFRTGDPKEFLKSHSKIDWNGINEPCPLWEKFINEVHGNKEEVDFMQRLFGYCATGSDKEHKFSIHSGEGRNGKTVEFETISHVLGSDFSYTTPADTLMEIKNDGGGQSAKPFLRALQGKRLVWATESKEGQRLSTAMIKHISGGGTMTARTLHEKPVTFTQTHKVMLITNHKPHVPADDQAIWDRVLVISYDKRFVDEPKAGEFLRDKDLSDKLKAESSGILAWIVRGCLEWQKQGLNEPNSVKAASIAYREDEDTVGDFVGECLKTGTGINSTVGEVYKRYKQWCMDGGQEPMSQKALGKRLRTRLGEPVKGRDGVSFQGVKVIL